MDGWRMEGRQGEAIHMDGLASAGSARDDEEKRWGFWHKVYFEKEREGLEGLKSQVFFPFPIFCKRARFTSPQRHKPETHP